MQFWQVLGDLHPKLVQFPLVLLFAGLIFDVCGLLARSPRCHFAAKALSAAGTLSLLVAFICGIYAELWAGRAGIPQEQIEWHELSANIASWGFVVLMAWRMFLDEDNRKPLTLYAVVGLLWYGLLVVTGLFGGRLVFDYGAAVTGGRANDILTLHDLNRLATRQTDENLRYSELVHHVSGWLTLALAASLLAGALFPARGERLKWVGPLILVLGGVALFFFADLDLYRLTDLRQLRDREVQLHKTLAIILATVGALGLHRFRHPRSSKARLTTPSRVVAVMALIGGGLLFTHVHTVAPYANVAAGVYIAHIVMGLTALGIGVARLAEDAWPRMKGAFALLFAALMCVESILLITYNEGLPWYIGYGRYQRWGASSDGARDDRATVAPYGPLRAQLDVDQETQRLVVTVKDCLSEAPVPIPVTELNLRISRGYDEISIPLAADGTRTRFSGVAPFLKNVMAFSARAELPVGGVMKMGYFDPWVTPAITPLPPYKVARFQCPMHDGIISEKQGVCPLCGMALLPMRQTRPVALHAADYDMRLETPARGEIIAGAPVLLAFRPLQNGKVLRELTLVHERLLHLIVISADFGFFDHVHPTLQPDGSLQLAYAFPRPGLYLLYADVTPAGQRAQVFRLPVVARTETDPPDPVWREPPLTPAPSLSKPLDDDPAMTAALFFQPRTPVAGIETHFLIRLSRDGRPVNDLEPYLGAMAHGVFLSRDSQIYLHCHPEQLIPPAPTARGGPDVPFATTFPKPGLYKLWIEFKRQHKTEVVSYVVDVKSPILPPSVIRFLLDE